MEYDPSPHSLSTGMSAQFNLVKILGAVDDDEYKRDHEYKMIL